MSEDSTPPDQYPAEYIDNGRATALSDEQLAETWQKVARYHHMRDSPTDSPLKEVRLTKRVNRLEAELMSRDFSPTEDDDGLLFGVENADGERIA